jgi:hypothetical protein
MGRLHVYRLAAHDKRIAVALCVSLLLHTPLFLPPGSFSIGSANESTAPAELRIELQGMGDAEPDKREAQQTPKPPEHAIAATVPESAESGESSDELHASASPHSGGSPTELRDPGELRAPPVEIARATVEEIIGDVTAPAEIASSPVETAEETSLAAPTALVDAAVATIAPAEVRQLKRLLEDEARDLLATRSTQRQVDFTGNERKYSAVLTRQPAADGMGVERVTVELVSEQGSQRVQTSLQLKRLAFSHFTQLVDQWDTKVQLHDDEIGGRFHSNSIINITYDRRVAPRLLGLVTTARYIRIAHEEGWRPRSQIFVGGLKTNTPRIRLPPIAVPVSQVAAGDAHVHVLPGDTLIVFRAEGAYDTTDLLSRTTNTHTIAAGKPHYIVGSGEPQLQVRGVVNGSVTVYSPRDIVIHGSLTYASDPRSQDADDYLGLVSDRNVEIARADVTGPGDLHVQAAIYARNRFVVRNVGARGGGTMFVYGSVTAGSISETEPRYGTRTDFDSRFERVRPPGFPETDRYEIDNWDERWHLAEGEPVENP